jgi:hypothetical protein
MTFDQMVTAFHLAMQEWPQRVVDAGVTDKLGRAYRPRSGASIWAVPVLKHPTEPYKTLAEAKAILNLPPHEFEGEPGQETSGWRAICTQADWRLTWEGIATDPKAPWAPLFTGAERHRVQAEGERTMRAYVPLAVVAKGAAA